MFTPPPAVSGVRSGSVTERAGERSTEGPTTQVGEVCAARTSFFLAAHLPAPLDLRRWLDPGLLELLSAALFARHESVGERLHEADKVILFGVGQAEIANLGGVQIVGRFRRRPASGSGAGAIRLTARQDVSRIVEVDD